MANNESARAALQKTPETKAVSVTLKSMLSDTAVKARFEEVLGKKAAAFMASILSTVNTNQRLRESDPTSTLAAAMIAATLDLPINQNLGFAALVPYKDRKSGKTLTQFQMMVKGFTQLAMRSGQYRTLNATEVYEGELVQYNRFTGEMEFDSAKRTTDKVIGFVAYERLVSGFEKFFYMTMDEAVAHGRKYSKSFDTGLWAEVKKGNYAMPLKTVLKLLLSKYGMLSVEMQKALDYDQAIVPDVDGDPMYLDNPDGELFPDDVDQTKEVKQEEPVNA